MKGSFHINKKVFWRTALLLYLVTALLSPIVHSHEFKHDDGEIHKAFTLDHTNSHNHADHDTLALYGHSLKANDTAYPRHNHNSSPHLHFGETFRPLAKRYIGSLEKYKVFFFNTVESTLFATKVSLVIYNQLSPTITSFNIKYLFNTIDLPPPAV